MTTLADCERQVLRTLIFVLRNALNCQSENNEHQSTLTESDVSIVERMIKTLLLQNETLGESIGGSSIFGVEEVVITDENSTDVLTNAKEETIYKGDTVEETGSAGVNLQKLEIIKVAVLIAVLSIIMLTTCRMVFQLFIRFRPEKPPLA